MTAFHWEMGKVTKVIFRPIAFGLGLENEEFVMPSFFDTIDHLRLHYPPVPVASLENQAMANMPAHSDWSSKLCSFRMTAVASRQACVAATDPGYFH